MTMIAGFTCGGGAVLCADSQETVSDYAKKHVDKISTFEGDGFKFACAGTGSGPYVDMAIDQLFLRLLQCKDLHVTKLATILQEMLSEYHSLHVWPRGPSDGKANIELLAVLSPEGGRPFLFHTSETAVNWIQGYRTMGIGRYLADYLLEHMLSPHGHEHHMLAVGAYILKKTRDYIEGCGGESHLYFFDNTGEMTWLWKKDLDRLDQVLNDFDNSVKDTFHAVTDIGTANPDALLRSLDGFRAVEEGMKDLVTRLGFHEEVERKLGNRDL